MKTGNKVAEGILLGVLAFVAITGISAGITFLARDAQAQPKAVDKCCPECCCAGEAKDGKRVGVFDSITVKSKDGKHTVAIAAGNDYAGLWVSNDRKQHACLYSSDTFTPYIAIQDWSSKSKSQACNLAFALGKDGEFTVQVRKGDDVRFYSPAQVIDALEKSK